MITWSGGASNNGLHIALGKLTGGPDDTTLDQRVSEATERHDRDGDVEAIIQADLALDVDEVHDGDDEEGEDEEGEAHVDADEGVGLAGVEDDEEETDEAHHHVYDGEYTVHADVRVEVVEVIDGRDEGVPWKEVPAAQSEVDYVGKVECVFWEFVIGCGGGGCGCSGGREEEGGLGISVADFAGDTHRRFRWGALAFGVCGYL